MLTNILFYGGILVLGTVAYLFKTYGKNIGDNYQRGYDNFLAKLEENLEYYQDNIAMVGNNCYGVLKTENAVDLCLFIISRHEITKRDIIIYLSNTLDIDHNEIEAYLLSIEELTEKEIRTYFSQHRTLSEMYIKSN